MLRHIYSPSKFSSVNPKHVNLALSACYKDVVLARMHIETSNLALIYYELCKWNLIKFSALDIDL